MDFLGNILSGQDLVNKDYVDKVIPVVPTKLSELTNDLGLGSLAYKSSLVASDIPALDWSKITSGKPTTLAGYGITNGARQSAGSDYASIFLDTATGNYGRLLMYSDLHLRLADSSWSREWIVLDSNNYANYALPLSGGTLQGDSADLLVINRLSSTSTAYICFMGNHSLRGRIGFDANKNPVVQDVNYGSGNQTLIHSGNYATQIGNYYLKSSGGILRDSWSGGTEIRRTDNTNGYAKLTFSQAGGIILGAFGFGGVDNPLFITSAGSYNTLIHSGNIGNNVPLRMARQSTIDLNTAANGFYEIAYSGQTLTNAPAVSNSLFVDFRDSSGLAKMQFIGVSHSAALFFRAQQGADATITSDWKQVAFTDSDISGNAATATRARYIETLNYTGAGWYGEKYKLFAQWYNPTNCDWKVTDDANNEYKVRVDIAKKLDTARTIWGQSFDGTRNVSGALSDVTNINGAITINSSGNVGIGTTTSEYKLDVNGTARVSGAVTMSSSLSVTGGSYCYGDAFFGAGKEGIYISSSGQSIAWHNTSNTYVKMMMSFASSSVLVYQELRPNANNSYTLGSSSYQWSTVYGVNGIFSGDTSSGSDIRFKDVIESKRIKIEDIANAPLFTFIWNDREDDSVHLGTSAQYWENVAPWLVKGEDFKTLDYATLGVAMGISLANKTMNLEDRVKILEDENKALKAEINRMRHDN